MSNSTGLGFFSCPVSFGMPINEDMVSIYNLLCRFNNSYLLFVYCNKLLKTIVIIYIVLSISDSLVTWLVMDIRVKPPKVVFLVQF